MEKLRDYLYDTKDDWNYITPTDFYKQYYHKKPYLLIDLRDKQSYDKGHIQGAKNIFWLNILDQPLPKDKKIFLICYNVTAIKYGYGQSPVQGVPVAGWMNYGFPTVGRCTRKTRRRKTKHDA